MKALAAAIRAFLTRLITVSRWVGGRLVTATHAVVEAAPAAAGGLLHAADAVISSPFRLASRAMAMLSVRGTPAPTEQSVAAQAAGAEAGQQQAGERTADRQLLRAVRSIARARADGAEPDAVLLASVPSPVAAYIQALELSECRALSGRSSADVRALLDGRPVPGVRTPEQVASTPVPRAKVLEVLTNENAYSAVAPRMRFA